MLIASYVPSLEGGAERQCRLIADALKDRGHTVDVITIRHSLEAESDEHVKGIRIRRLGRLDPIALSINRFIRLFALKNKKSFDLIHVHESGWLAGIGASLGKLWNIPVN